MAIQKTKLRSVASGFAITAMVFAIIAILPMCWMIPMTNAIRHRIEENKEISLALLICYLIFGGIFGIVASILLLVDRSNQNSKKPAAPAQGGNK